MALEFEKCAPHQGDVELWEAEEPGFRFVVRLEQGAQVWDAMVLDAQTSDAIDFWHLPTKEAAMEKLSSYYEERAGAVAGVSP